MNQVIKKTTKNTEQIKKTCSTELDKTDQSIPYINLFLSWKNIMIKNLNKKKTHQQQEENRGANTDETVNWHKTHSQKKKEKLETETKSTTKL